MKNLTYWFFVLNITLFMIPTTLGWAILPLVAIIEGTSVLYLLVPVFESAILMACCWYSVIVILYRGEVAFSRKSRTALFLGRLGVTWVVLGWVSILLLPTSWRTIYPVALICSGVSGTLMIPMAVFLLQEHRLAPEMALLGATE